MVETMVRVTLNGEGLELPAGITVADLLTRLGRGEGRCAVELNRGIVPRSTHDQVVLHDGDVVEIVTFVGGG